VQKADENVREHQSALEKEKHKVSIKELSLDAGVVRLRRQLQPIARTSGY
jgi:hypothetical protein